MEVKIWKKRQVLQDEQWVLLVSINGPN